MNKIEKKLLGVKTYKINGIKFELKKVTLEDYLGKEGIPISKWQTEANFFLTKQKEGTVTISEIQKTWTAAFNKTIVSINGDYNIKDLIPKIAENIDLASDLYNKVGEHCFDLKKKSKPFQKIQQLLMT